MGLQQQAARELKWSFIAQWGRQGLSFVVFTVLAHLLAPKEFGLVALAGVYLALMEIFVTQGLGMALIQRKELRKEHIDAVFWLAMGSASLITIVTLVIAPWVAEILGDPALAPVIRALSPAFLFSACCTVQIAIIQRNMKFESLAKTLLASSIVAGTFGITLAALGAGVWSLVAQTLTGGVASLVVLWNASDWRPSLKVDLAPVRELLGVSSKVMLGNGLGFVQGQFDRLAIGRNLGATSLGVYSTGSRMGTLLTDAFQGPLSAVALPAFAKVEDDARMSAGIARVIELSCAVTFPIATYLFVFADVLIPLVFGAQWVVAVPVFRFAAVAFAFQSAFHFSWVALMARGRAGLCLVLNAVDAVASTGAAFAGLQFGPAGVAAAITAKVLVVGVVGIFMLRGVVGLTVGSVGRAILRPAPAAAAALGACAAAKHFAATVDCPGVVVAAVAGVLTVAVYLATLHVTSRPTTDALRTAVLGALRPRE